MISQIMKIIRIIIRLDPSEASVTASGLCNYRDQLFERKDKFPSCDFVLTTGMTR